VFFKPVKRVGLVPSEVKTTIGAYYALSACFALAHYQAERAKDCRRDEEIWRNEALARDIEGVKGSGSVATSVKDRGSSIGTESDLFTEEVCSTTGSTAPPLSVVSSPQIPPFSTQLLQSLILNNQPDGSSESGDVDLEHLAREDSPATQVWEMYAKTKAGLPHQQRMENLTWRMMALALKKKEREEKEKEKAEKEKAESRGKEVKLQSEDERDVLLATSSEAKQLQLDALGERGRRINKGKPRVRVVDFHGTNLDGGEALE
jgi:GATA-binding protein